MGALGNLFNKLFKPKDIPLNKLNKLDIFTPQFSEGVRREFNATLMSCVNAHARHFSRIEPVAYLKDNPAENKQALNKVLQLEPNAVMNGPVFWKAVTRSYFLDNLVIIYIDWDYFSYPMKVRSLWPLDIAKNAVETATTQDGKVALRFHLNGTVRTEMAEDLIILQREANIADILANRSPAINNSLKVLQTSYEGLDQALKASQFIRFIVTSATNLNDEVVKKRQEEFSEQMFNNKGLIYLSGSNDIKEVQSNGKWPLSPELQNIKNDIYEYQGITPNIVKGDYTEEQWQSYFESSLQPLAIEIQAELTRKLFSAREIELGNRIRVITDPLDTVTFKTRVNIAGVMIKLPTVKSNDVLKLLQQPEHEGGDIPQSSLNWVEAASKNEYQLNLKNAKIKDDEPKTEEEQESENE